MVCLLFILFFEQSPEGSWDLNSNDGDPMPRVDEAGLNHHGTRCELNSTIFVILFIQDIVASFWYNK